MKRTLNYLIIGSMTCLACACGNSHDSKDMAKEENKEKLENTDLQGDAKFAVDAADIGMLEVKLGQLAQKNGSAADIKEMGRMLETDHTQANNELREWASKKNVTLPETLSEGSQKKYNDLSAKTGTDFDKEYASCMVDGHEKTIDKFKKEVSDGKDDELKNWANGKVPALEHHLEMAKSSKELHH